jgi:hypothetical protein
MVSVDNYPALALGDCLDESQADIINYKCASGITKGQLVVFSAHVAGELPTIATAGAAATNVLGVALKTGLTGESIPVCSKGVVKVTASGGITGGVLIVAAASGAVITIGANTFEKIVGRAIQTFLDTDTGLAFIDCESS